MLTICTSTITIAVSIRPNPQASAVGPVREIGAGSLGLPHVCRNTLLL